MDRCLRWLIPASLALLPGCGFATASLSAAASSGGGTTTAQSPPAAMLDVTGFAVMSDQRLGIPVRFGVTDANGDDVEMVFQWRRDGEAFEALPDDPAALRAALTDPQRRRELRIATAYDRPVATGRFLPVGTGNLEVELPELSSGRSSRLGGAVRGRRLGVLRARERIVDPRLDWNTGGATLDGPVAASPVDDGRRAVVLDAVAGGWRTRVIELATGKVVGSAATGPGTPSAMTLEEGGASALVASLGATWMVHRVRLSPPEVTLLVVDTGVTDGGTIHAVESLGTASALVTVGSSLVRLDYPAGLPSNAVTLLQGLAAPRGIARDPLEPNVVYVAESAWLGGATTGRILRVSLADGTATALGAEPELPRPGSLAIEGSSVRLVAVTDADPGDATVELRGVGLAGAGAGRSFTIAEEIPASGSDAVHVATGRDGLRTVAVRQPATVLVSGGLEQVRTVVDLQADKITVDIAFAPPLDARRAGARRWRLEPVRDRLSTSGGDARDVFVWDSRDVPGGGVVALRGTPLDARIGSSGETGPTRAVLDPLDTEPLRLLTTGLRTVTSLAVGDVDADGAPDLVGVGHEPTQAGASDDGALLFWMQGAAGTFGGVPDLIVGSTPTVRSPSAVAISDLDGDGLDDVIVANGNPLVGFPAGNFVALYYQAPGTGFVGHGPAGDRILGSTSNTYDPIDLAVLDLNRDGRVDIVTANRRGGDLSVFYQRGDGSFGAGPSPSTPDLKLGAPAQIPFPISVAAQDLDRDGLVDVVATGFAGSELFLYRQTETAPGTIPGTFAPVVRLGGPGVLDFPTDVDAGDIDGDGRADLACAHHADGVSRVGVFLQKADGTFGTLGPTVREPDLDLPNACVPSEVQIDLAIADLDGDGATDIAVRTATAVAVFSQTGPAMFQAATCMTPDDAIEPTTFTKLPLLVADLDQDGDPDLAVAVVDGAHAFLQDRGGRHGASSSLNLGLGIPGEAGEAAFFDVGDLDGNGTLDVLAGRKSESVLRMFAQDAPAQLSPAAGLGGPTVPTPYAVELVDLDRNGLVDALVSLEGETSQSALFLQSAPGVLGSGGDRTQPNLRLISRSAGVMGPLPAIAGSLVDSPGTADDGLVDVVVSDPVADLLLVFQQTLPGVFGVGAPLAAEPSFVVDPTSTSPHARGVAIADVLDLAPPTDDGLPDLVVANPMQRTVSIYAQVGPGRFGVAGDQETPHIVLGSAVALASVTFVAVEDLDGNGLLDVVCGPTQAAFLQQSPGVFGAAGDPTTPNLRFSGTAASIEVEDLDGDGDLDLVSAGAGEIRIYLQSNPGEIGQPSGGTNLPDRTLPAPAIAAVRLVDVDDDLDPDIVGVNQTGALVTLFFGGQ